MKAVLLVCTDNVSDDMKLITSELSSLEIPYCLFKVGRKAIDLFDKINKVQWSGFSCVLVSAEVDRSLPDFVYKHTHLPVVAVRRKYEGTFNFCPVIHETDAANFIGRLFIPYATKITKKLHDDFSGVLSDTDYELMDFGSSVKDNRLLYFASIQDCLNTGSKDQDVLIYNNENDLKLVCLPGLKEISGFDCKAEKVKHFSHGKDEHGGNIISALCYDNLLYCLDDLSKVSKPNKLDNDLEYCGIYDKSKLLCLSKSFCDKNLSCSHNSLYLKPFDIVLFGMQTWKDSAVGNILYYEFPKIKSIVPWPEKNKIILLNFDNQVSFFDISAKTWSEPLKNFLPISYFKSVNSIKAKGNLCALYGIGNNSKPLLVIVRYNKDEVKVFSKAIDCTVVGWDLNFPKNELIYFNYLDKSLNIIKIDDKSDLVFTFGMEEHVRNITCSDSGNFIAYSEATGRMGILRRRWDDI